LEGKPVNQKAGYQIKNQIKRKGYFLEISGDKKLP
jgi:hypothetical protein